MKRGNFCPSGCMMDEKRLSSEASGPSGERKREPVCVESHVFLMK